MGQNNAIYFDGNDSYIEANNVSNVLSGSTELTMETWVKRSVNPERPFILTFHQPDELDKQNVILLGIQSTGELAMTYNDNLGSGDVDKIGTAQVPTNEWTHIAVTIAADNSVKTYINGVLDFTWSIPIRPIDGGYFSIGQDFDSNAITDDFLGQMDEVRIWSDVRTQDELRSNMYKELSGNETDLIAYYNMNTGSGTTLQDNSTNSTPGKFVNTPEWKTSGAFSGPRNSINFDGVDDYITIPDDNSLDFGTGDFTFEF